MNNKKRYVDSHIHLYSWFDSEGINFFDGLDRFQETCGAKAINICSLSPGIWGDVSNNIMAALYKLHNPSAFAYGGFVYPNKPIQLPFPEGMDIFTQYQELLDIGFDGIKIIETKPCFIKQLGVYINHECYDSFFRQAEKDGTPFVWHVADPWFFWDPKKEASLPKGWYYGNGEYPPFEEILSWAYEILDRYPKLKVTFAHFFFLAENPERLEELFSKYENVRIDITPGTEMYETFNQNHEFYKKFIKKYADRIVYGTDCAFPAEGDNEVLSNAVYKVVTTTEVADNIWGVKAKGFAFSEDASDKILYKNFMGLHGQPKEINKSALKRYIDKYAHLILDEKVRAEVEKHARLL